ncbi:MAG: transglutaminase domain-containing protein [Calditrichaeota bacterium]|nr:transglutaminase domain-containing protein [Calditrichota bacterium]
MHSLCKKYGVDARYLDALLQNLDDADLVQVSAAELFDDLLASLEAREQLPWAQELSDADFRRYVIPVRIDDEPLQRYRRWLMQELAAAVKGCQNAEEAALEVNLWLGQRVTFRPTDWRDQGPLTTISCGFGRCGEETILLVAALRSVGVAARMAYVPYWAQCDNNHAWVEVKVGDRWKYLGACEPEGMLDRAWFDEPVLRAPILLANVSDVDSTEPDAVKGRRLWQLNSTRNYMEPCRLTVNLPEDWSENDRLFLAVFNFGGIRPLVRFLPDRAMDVGVGDFLLLGQYKEKLFLQKASTQGGESLDATMDPTAGLPSELALCYPQPKGEPRAQASETWQWRLKMARCQLELAQEKKNEAPEWCVNLAATSDSTLARLLAFVQKARGNSECLWQMYQGKSDSERKLLLDVLDCLSEKDLREISQETLADYFEGAVHAIQRFDSNVDSLRKYVLSPRFGWEPTRPWRMALEEKMGEIPQGSFVERARRINEIVAKRIGPMEGFRALDPFTAWEAGSVNEKLAPALACGMLRIAGVPSYVTVGKEWVTFYDGGQWRPLYPARPEQLGIVQDEEKERAWFEKPATVTLTFPTNLGKINYEETFDLVRLVEGWPDDRAEAILDYAVSDSHAILSVVPGDYLLTWGLRNGRGDVRFGMRRIRVAAGGISEEYLLLARPPEIEATPVDTSMISTEISFMAGNPQLSLREYMASESVLIFVAAAHHEPSVRMIEMAKALANEGHPVLILSGPGEITGYPEASQTLLRNLKIPLSETDFRNGAPYYRYLMPNGKVAYSGNGYELNFKSDFERIFEKTQQGKK